MVDLARKSPNALAWPMVLGTHSTRVLFNIINIYASGQRFKSKLLVLFVLLCNYETWMLNSDLEKHSNAIGTKYLCRIIG